MYFQADGAHAYILRLSRGEQLLPSLTKFCHQQLIGGGFFYGLGAVDQAELALYNVDTQQYAKQTFTQPLEVANLTGSIGLDQGQVVIHAHATLGKADQSALAGHVIDMRISGTLEVYLQTTTPLTKDTDSQTGLKVFQLDQSV